MPICDDVVVAVLQKSQSSEWRHVVVAVQLSRVSSRGRVKVYVDGRRVGRGRLQGTYMSRMDVHLATPSPESLHITL